MAYMIGSNIGSLSHHRTAGEGVWPRFIGFDTHLEVCSVKVYERSIAPAVLSGFSNV